jgi:hypothetical protein
VEDRVFDVPVKILTGKYNSVVRPVRSTAEAAKYLLNQWPIENSHKHLAARQACFDVLQGLKAARVARKAFAEAAGEADILVSSPAESLRQ